MQTTLHLTIAGRVQGVGYRANLCEVATRLGVSGWVRNCRNGDVEAVLRGTPAACESVAEWARRGPREALVTRVDTRPASAEESALIGSGFDALPTA